MEPGLQVEGQAPLQGRVLQGRSQRCPAVHLELVCREAPVEPPEVRDEA